MPAWPCGCGGFKGLPTALAVGVARLQDHTRPISTTIAFWGGRPWHTRRICDKMSTTTSGSKHIGIHLERRWLQEARPQGASLGTSASWTLATEEHSWPWLHYFTPSPSCPLSLQCLSAPCQTELLPLGPLFSAASWPASYSGSACLRPVSGRREGGKVHKKTSRSPASSGLFF